MWLRTLTLLALIVASVPACARQDLPGCYSVDISGANGGVTHAPGIRLTDQSIAGPKAQLGAKRVIPATTTGKFSYPVAYWLSHNGEIVVTFTYEAYDGVGTEMRVHRSPKGALQGVIEQYWDTGDVSSAHPVVLRKVACGAG
jgi:hypothetical protein